MNEALNNLLFEYVAGRLSGEQLAQVERLIESDKNVRDKVLKLQSFKMHGNESPLKSKAFDSSNEAWQSGLQEKSKANYTKWAAAIALLFLSSAVVFWLNTRVDSQALFEDYYQTYPNYLSQASRATDDVDYGAQPSTLYEQGKFAVLAKELNKYKDNGMVTFYKGLCYAELEDYQKSDSLFRITFNDELFGEQSHWYYGLTLLKRGDKEKASELFKKVCNKMTYKQTEACEIVGELGS